jgi:hypothetical protein
MAGSITISSITLDSDNNFSIKSNTGATLFFANTSGVDVANSLPSSSITSDKILSVANTKITGNITANNITGGSNGTIPYQTASGITAMSAVGTAGQFLQSAGAGAPVWAAAGASVSRSAKTANYTLVAGDKGNLVVATSGTFTFSFTAAATLADGWFCYIQNAGTGNITLDPNGSETIDSLTSYIMYPGEVRLVQCTGTAFNSVVLSGFTLTYTSGANTFTKPPGYQAFDVLLYGAGGGGGSGRKGGQLDGQGGTGGGGGAFISFKFTVDRIGATETVTVGAGGTAGASRTTTTNGLAGGTGGTTTFGSLLTAFGGAGGAGGANASAGTGGRGGGILTQSGGPVGFNGADGSSGAAGGNSAFGGGAGGGAGTGGVNTSGLAGGNSIFGGGGGGGGGGWGNGVDTNGGAGGSQTGLTGGGGAGGVASTQTAPVDQTTLGKGGGGGFVKNGTSNSAGAAGGIAAGGGGGGAGFENQAVDSGAGGVGGSGYAIITGGMQ